MIDIVSWEDGQDIGVFDTQVMQAGNILSVQLGALEYAPELGVDLKFFLQEEFRFQNESFKSYLIQVLANAGINVSSVLDQVEALHRKYTFNLVPEETGTGLVAR